MMKKIQLFVLLAFASFAQASHQDVDVRIDCIDKGLGEYAYVVTENGHSYKPFKDMYAAAQFAATFGIPSAKSYEKKKPVQEIADGSLCAGFKSIASEVNK